MNMNKKKEVQTWIAEAKKKGYNQAQIEEELKKQGYSTDITNKTLEGNNKWGRSKTIITLAVLIVLILGMIGYFVFYRPNTAEYKLDTANALAEEGKTDEALKAYQEILTQHPDTRWAYLSNLHNGELYFDKGDYESAIPYFKEAIKLNPDKDCDSNNKLGQIYLRKMDYDTALQYFFAVLAISKNSEENCPLQRVANTNLNIGRIYLEKGNYTQSLAYLREAYESNPDSAYINYNLGKAYYLSGKYDGAKIYLKNSLRLDNASEVASVAKSYLKEIQEKESA